MVQALGNGNLIAVWVSQSGDGSRNALMSRVFNASGVPQGNEIRINQFTRGNQEEVAITRLADGSLITVWMSEGQDGSEEGIVARQLTAEGVPQGNEFVVNVTTVGEQNLPSVAALKDGGFIVAWSNVDTNPDTMAREYDADLNLVTGEVQLTPNSSTGFLRPELVSLSNGGVGAVWMTLRVLGFFPTVGAEVRTTRSEVPVPTDNNDTLTYEGESSNILALGGNDWITPGGGSDTIDGGTGFDMVSFINQSQAVRVELSTGRATSGNGVNLLSNIEGITGSSFGDYIVGDDGNNRLRGAGSYDWFVGSEGADRYDGGSGLDMISYSASTSAVSVFLSQGRGTQGDAARDSYTSVERVTG
ncbi:hypothetical protein DS909_20410 [Phaeobacter gallaeciensis]|uniref:Calcium-binding protein n=2 Tax=Roseobacteraceae TaxID=2854170 RepID=A0A366WNE7_9RHOB|nr:MULTISPECIES: hypothetical protein [Roseobacteraceae]MBT3141515.1 hypothetical protein [Falsiruegeria litorea]MBT8167343.1 hypothetical protein [Falsiruegeria litorea]RBW50916.1 hypothetical protein DS909_20410 [Phaeobacter gallaeciensis]